MLKKIKNKMPLKVPREQQILKERLVKPRWLKVKAPGSPTFLETRKLVKGLRLHTVCEEAHCPNIGECWSHRTATFMILGEYCTRRCHFCAVKDGTPETLKPPDPLEPYRVGLAVKKLALKHIVVTSVDRDDLPDFGAEHFLRTTRAIKAHNPHCRVELLVPDFNGSFESIKTVMSGEVDVLNHNIETVPRLYKKVRPKASYEQSLRILRWAKELKPEALTKSGIMVGLGETIDEILAVMDDLRENMVDIMTIGQYLRPTKKQMPVREFYTPEEFNFLREEGLKRGFK
ncbi:MAG: lipoyl synthase, partial [Candidatus Dadabacteria bacterium]